LGLVVHEEEARTSWARGLTRRATAYTVGLTSPPQERLFCAPRRRALSEKGGERERHLGSREGGVGRMSMRKERTKP